MNEPTIKSEVVDGLAHIYLNRPEKRNALNREMLIQLQSQIDGLVSRDGMRAVVLHAVGSVFCAGMDLGQMQERAVEADRAEQWREDSAAYRRVLLALINCQLPTVAVLPGPAVAGGVGLAIACDMIIASRSAFFALPEPRRGIVAAMVAPLLLRRMSRARAAYVLLSGKRIPAAHALQIGLCDELVEPSELESAWQSLVYSILECSPDAVAATKQFLETITDAATTKTLLEQAERVSADARSSDDAREGLKAFLEKRKPNWAPKNDSH